MYVFTYPWTPVSNPVPPYNALADVGCNSTTYSWCDTSYAPAAPLLLIVIAVVMGIGIPLSSVALDAIYSKTLGPINQVRASKILEKINEHYFFNTFFFKTIPFVERNARSHDRRRGRYSHSGTNLLVVST